MRVRLSLLPLLLLTAIAAACSSDAPTGSLDATTPLGDSGPGPSDGEVFDDASVDAGDRDTGPLSDSGIEEDAGTSTTTDAGPMNDAGTSTIADAGPADAGPGPDGGPTPDGGTPDTGLPSDLGDACNAPGDCSTNFCFQRVGTDVCSLCAVNGDCGVQQACAYSGELGYAQCVGTGNLGASCNGDNQCRSGHCNSGICSECQIDDDCGPGGTCVDDTSGEGYFVCSGGLGDACQSGADCGTGFCFDPPGGGPNRCSECEVNGDCGAQRSCDYSFGDDYASCVGNGVLGNICNTGDQCRSGFCQGGVCSECEATADCENGGSCEDDTGGVGYYVCAGGLGEACTSANDCNSGFCYDAPVGPDRCSECAVSQDCPNNQTCIPDVIAGYARCF